MGLTIVHLSFVRELSPGQLKQISWEYAVSQNFNDAYWTTLAYQHHKSDLPFVKQVPRFMHFSFLRKLFAWIWMLRHHNEYDYVVCRHMTFDPFAPLFSWFVPNRVTVHHAKEIEELKYVRSGWMGIAASALERISGRCVIRNVYALVGVTNDIRKYELDRKGCGTIVPSSVFPNGVLLDAVKVVEDNRVPGNVEVAFVCGKFSVWQGLDLLLDHLMSNVECQKVKITFHLIGTLTEEQEQQVDRVNKEACDVEILKHGLLNMDELEKIMARCHLGLGSLALERKGMTEAATLKVREMLAQGVPVLSAHPDAGLPDDFPFYCTGFPTSQKIVEFAASMEGVSRHEVRESSAPFIEKKECMRSFVKFLEYISDDGGSFRES